MKFQYFFSLLLTKTSYKLKKHLFNKKRLKDGKYGIGPIYGSNITYQCNEGYKLSNKSQSFKICQSDGTWSG